ncbi:hypothetical protein Syun_010594 [Stephania yunnanensis]|uniref:GPI-anchored protein LLG1-like domain-containing protein n=1 Tax=Stephania yunnanensis TaxID=152371 RepID=A0AAP0KHQ8_9MAGN
MAWMRRGFVPLVLLFLMGYAGISASSSSISGRVCFLNNGSEQFNNSSNCLHFDIHVRVAGDVFEAHGPVALPVGRALLQTKKACPVNFEYLNYTIITSQCKGPKYPPNLCCGALKEFACPYAAQLNDVSNDCASTMFSYINLYGKYPPGLFASECREGKQGLECPALPPGQPANDTNHAFTLRRTLSSFILPLALSLLLLFQIVS